MSTVDELKMKLKELEAEQASTTIAGVHYKPFDTAATSIQKRQKISEARSRAVAPTTPQPPPGRGAPQQAALSEETMLQAADAAFRRHPSTPFAVEDSRTLHAVQQDALNAEIRETCEMQMSAWQARFLRQIDAINALNSDAPGVGSALVKVLKQYEDQYQCVHSIDESSLSRQLETELCLRLSEPILKEFVDGPPLDREAFSTALASLCAPSQVRMPVARREQRFSTISAIDQLSRATAGAAALRLYEDLHFDVLSPLRLTLAEATQRLAALRSRIEALGEKKIQSRNAPDDNAQPSLNSGSMFALSEQHHREESECRVELVDELIDRCTLVAANREAVELHAHQCQTDLEAGSTIGAKMNQMFRQSRTDAASDVQALRKKHQVIADSMLESHQAFLRDQVNGHATIMSLQAQEQQVWAEISILLDEANKLSSARHKCVAERMLARETEALKQRVAAQEMAVVRRRQVMTENAARIMDNLIEASNEYNEFVRTMAVRIEQRGLLQEFATVHRQVLLEAVSEGEGMLEVVYDLLARLQGRASMLSLKAGQTELDVVEALETLDPDANGHDSVVRHAKQTVSALETTAGQFESEVDRLLLSLVPLLDIAISNEWIDDAKREQLPFIAKSTALERRMDYHQRAMRLIGEEQLAAEEHLTKIRHARSDANLAAHHHSLRYA